MNVSALRCAAHYNRTVAGTEVLLSVVGEFCTQLVIWESGIMSDICKLQIWEQWSQSLRARHSRTKLGILAGAAGPSTP